VIAELSIVSNDLSVRAGTAVRRSRSASVLFAWYYLVKFASVKLFDAIHEMRRLTHEGIPFSMTYMSFNETNGTSEGIIHVRSAKLRARERKDFNRNAEDQEAYLNLDTNEPRRFWHPLLMEFNGEKVTL